MPYFIAIFVLKVKVLSQYNLLYKEFTSIQIQQSGPSDIMDFRQQLWRVRAVMAYIILNLCIENL